MTELKEVTRYLDELLRIADFRSDASNNGLQFEGAREVAKAVFGVDASSALFTAAADAGADFIFVHHGISWGASLKRIVALDAKRVSILAANNMSLYGAHLPLDAHPELGHNARIAAMLKIKQLLPFGEYAGKFIGFHGKLPRPASLEQVTALLNGRLASTGDFAFFGPPKARIKHIGVISGGGAFSSAFAEAYELGVDCLVTGEMEHSAFHYAREAGVSVLALGHYRSEIPGVLAVMDQVKKHFQLAVEFIDLPTGL